jgi:hypothetical protein
VPSPAPTTTPAPTPEPRPIGPAPLPQPNPTPVVIPTSTTGTTGTTNTTGTAGTTGAGTSTTSTTDTTSGTKKNAFDYTNVLNALYQQDFNRSYDPVADKAVADKLASGELSPANLAQYIAQNAQGNDLAYYQTHLGKPATSTTSTTGSTGSTGTTGAGTTGGTTKITGKPVVAPVGADMANYTNHHLFQRRAIQAAPIMKTLIM